MRIELLGDSALLVRVVEQFDADDSLDAVLRATQQLQAAQIPGIIELAPAYATIGVFFEPARVGTIQELNDGIERALEQEPTSAMENISGPATEIPVCYESEFALDMNTVAQHASLSPDEVIRRHATANYRVSCVGFAPGFPYLIGLPPELATPRRASPRKEIPAGAVAIGGRQTGIYPRKSPGGWNIIGRTPLSLFDVTRERPALLRAGDRIRFRRITRDEFYESSP
jgi:inhibitor of KinA